MQRTLFALLLLLLGSATANAGPSPGIPGASAGSPLVQAPSAPRPSYVLTSAEVDSVVQQGEDKTPDWESVHGKEAPRRWWPIALSLVLPGLGEATTGYTRGYFLMAADLASLGAAYHYNEEGDAEEANYIAFADEYWSEEDWAEALRTVDTAPWFGTNYQNPEDVPLYVSKDEDPREYYENLGKWDIFWYGWADSRTPIEVQPGWDWENPPAEFMTPLRDQYIDMRNASNDAYEWRDRFVSLSLLLRVFSVLEVTYLEGFIGGKYNNDYEGPGVGGKVASLGDEDGARLNWFVDASRPTESRLGLQLRY